MGIISIFYGSFCHEKEIVELVAQRVGAVVLDDPKLLELTQARFGVQALALERSLFQGKRSGAFFAVEKRRHLTMVRRTLADKLVDLALDKVLCSGFLAHLVPRSVNHVFHVCLIADFGFRVERAMADLGLSMDLARERVTGDDRVRAVWTGELLRKEPWDHTLYDLVLPMDRKSVEEAAAAIVEHSRKDLLQPDDLSRKALTDFQLQAAVELALAEEGHTAQVKAVGDRIELLITQNVIMLSKLEEELRDIVAGVAGVGEVIVNLSPEFYQKTMYRQHQPEQRKKLLLVDDEREFVHTLSERLLMREIGSAVVYDGEQALAFVEEDEPDVMVLDLKMPGIDGLEVLRRVKAAHPQIQVIILTGHGSKEDERNCLDAGAFAYLQKPVDIDVLTRLLEQARVREEEQPRTTHPGEHENGA
ncbi:response regulator [Desulfonatronum sp. SC1]|uniref:response regulator n=1 Tax=Desulfonatronum sp. SC1 TaxID=2109626 RepID=UPI000D3224A5|nr:response regulator [Desulfonatronum sp. SC1]PTN32051.1 response regulator [Desulfonatronum sp. SC1]